MRFAPGGGAPKNEESSTSNPQHQPHGGVRCFRQKSTCITQLTLRMSLQLGSKIRLKAIFVYPFSEITGKPFTFRPIRTRCCFAMTNMIQMCNNFHTSQRVRPSQAFPVQFPIFSEPKIAKRFPTPSQNQR